MRKMIEELWYGNIFPNRDCRVETPEIKTAKKYVVNHYHALQAMLTDEQMEIFEKYNNSCDELTDANEREIFFYAFQLGARLTIEIMYNNINQQE